MIPASLLPHTVTVTTPTTATDAYGNEVLVYADSGPTVRTMVAYVQPRIGEEDTVDRDAVTRAWSMWTDGPVEALERVAFDGSVYEVDGPPRRWDTPAGTHHYLAHLALTEG